MNDMENFLKQYGALVGKPGFTDTPDGPWGYSNQWQQKQGIVEPLIGANDRDYYDDIPNQQFILELLMNKHPKEQKSLLDYLYNLRRNGIDSDLNQSQFGRETRNNSLRMEEMKYLPSGKWDKLPGPMFPMPRRM